MTKKQNNMMEKCLSAYKYAYVASARSKNEIMEFRNRKGRFLKSLSLALGIDIQEKDVRPPLFQDAEINMWIKETRAETPQKKNYIRHFQKRWGYMHKLFSGQITLWHLTAYAEKRMRELDVESEREKELKKYVTSLFIHGVTVEEVKIALKKSKKRRKKLAPWAEAC